MTILSSKCQSLKIENLKILRKVISLKKRRQCRSSSVVKMFLSVYYVQTELAKLNSQRSRARGQDIADRVHACAIVAYNPKIEYRRKFESGYRFPYEASLTELNPEMRYNDVIV